MLKYYKYPLKVWITVVLLSPLLYFLMVYIFSMIPSMENYGFSNSLERFFDGYGDTVSVCLTFGFVFWIVYALLEKLKVKNKKLCLLILFPLLWWGAFYYVLGIVNDYFTFDIYFRLIPYSIVLAASILFYKLENS